MKRTITICAYNRPDYLWQVVESLNDALYYCVEYQPETIVLGIDGYKPGTDGPGQADVYDAVNELLPLNSEVICWPEHLGVSEHPRRLLQYVFTEADSDYNLHLEDDTVLSPDALRLALWHSRTALPQEALCLCLHSPGSTTPPKGTDWRLNRCYKRSDFGVWGWATTAQQWARWFAQYWNHKREGQLGWDWSVSDTMAVNRLYAVAPYLSRVRNVGRERGEHQTPEGYDEEQAGGARRHAVNQQFPPLIKTLGDKYDLHGHNQN